MGTPSPMFKCTVKAELFSLKRNTFFQTTSDQETISASIETISAPKIKQDLLDRKWGFRKNSFHHLNLFLTVFKKLCIVSFHNYYNYRYNL